MSTKVCSNHFAQGYRTSECPTPRLYMKRYDCASKSKRPSPKLRSTQIKESHSKKRKRSSDETEVPVENEPFVEDGTLLEENTELDHVASAFPADTDHEARFLFESATQTVSKSSEREEKIFH